MNSSAALPNGLAGDAMGVTDLVFTVLAALAPLTLMVAVAPLHFLKGGSAVPGAFIVAGGVMCLFSVGFTAMSRHVHNAGAFYSIIAHGLGKPIGGGAAVVAVVAYNVLQISTYGAFGLYAAQTLQQLFGITLPWWSLALVSLVCVTWLGYRGIETSSRVLGCILVAEISVLIVLAVAVVHRGGHEGFPLAPYAPSNVLRPDKAAMFALIFGSFMGFEATTIFSEEARGGVRTVRRATFIAVGFISVFYSLMTAVVVMAYGASSIQRLAERDPVNLVVNLFVEYTPAWMTSLMQILLLGSAFAALLALHNVANRYFYALGRERLLPKVLSRTHGVYQSPWVAGLCQSSLAVVLIVLTLACGVDPYLGLLLWGSALGLVGIIFLWALCSAAVIVYFRRHAEDGNVWATFVAPLVALVALVAVFALALMNFSFLTGATAQVNDWLLSVMSAAFILGLGVTLRMRSRNPRHYAALAAGEWRGLS
jgi:amino acid transporter